MCRPLVLTVEPDWATFFTEESVKFMCDMGEGKDGHYALAKDDQYLYPLSPLKTYIVQLQTTYQSGKYYCMCYNLQTGTTELSNVVSLTVSRKSC